MFSCKTPNRFVQQFTSVMSKVAARQAIEAAARRGDAPKAYQELSNALRSKPPVKDSKCFFYAAQAVVNQHGSRTKGNPHKAASNIRGSAGSGSWADLLQEKLLKEKLMR